MNRIDDHFDLTVGEERTIELPGLGTSGYVWQEKIIGPPEVVTVSWSRGFAPGTEPAAVGLSAPEHMSVRATVAGEVDLLLIQIQPWEPDAEPINERLVSIRVSPSGSDASHS